MKEQASLTLVRENLSGYVYRLPEKETPLRDRLKREKGSGLAASWNIMTAFGTGNAPFAEGGTPTEDGTTYARRSAAYKELGKKKSITDKMLAAGASFTDIEALETEVAIRETIQGLNRKTILMLDKKPLLNGEEIDCEMFDGLYNRQGLSMPEIAKRLNIKTRTVETCLKKCAIRKDWEARIITKDIEYRDKEVLEQHLANNRNASQIAELYGLAAKTILYWIGVHGIPYSKQMGYDRQRRNAQKRAAQKAKRKAKKEADRIADMKYPGRGKGRVMSYQSRLKSSISNVCRKNVQIKIGEKIFEEVIVSLSVHAQPEIPITLFDNHDRVIASYRVDYLIDVGVLHDKHPVVIQFDGPWHHQRPKVRRRDLFLNQFAPRAGIILVRIWSTEVPNVKTGSSVMKGLFAAVRNLQTPALVRNQAEIVDERTVRVSKKIEAKRNYIGEPDFKFQVIDSSKTLNAIKKKIDRGEWVKPEDVL